MKYIDIDSRYDRIIIWGCYGLIVLFSVSLPLPAFDWMVGWECLTLVPFVMTGLPWWANLFFFIGLPSLLLGNPILAFGSGVVATLLSLSTPVLFSTSSLGPRYFTWLGCMVGLTWLAWFDMARPNPEDQAGRYKQSAEVNGRGGGSQLHNHNR